MERVNKLFIIGSDDKSEWMLKWFMDNFKQHNPNANILLWDFGMKNNPYPEITKKLNNDPKKGGWFNKPDALIESTKYGEYICWLDIDCHIHSNIEDIFNYVEDEKLAMVEDVPWSSRTREKWHNSGVVAFRNNPQILQLWVNYIGKLAQRGDQEVLHQILMALKNINNFITDLPREYNTLRLDLLDGTAPKNPKIMHWTGPKGKDKIRELMRNV